MKVERAIVIRFNDKEPKSEFNVRIPVGSRRLDFVTLPDGVYLLYLAPDIISNESEVWTFVVGGPNQFIDASKHEFLQTISIFVPPINPETGEEIEGAAPNTIIFPFFLQKAN